jgi:hypothetical protein
MLAADLAMALDPVELARAAGVHPDPYQMEVLRSSASRILLNWARQVGKSETAALLADWTALYQPGALVLVVSPSLRQSQLLFRRCLDLYRVLGRPVPAEAETKLTLELENGSRLVSLPGREGTIRGYSAVSLLLIDEAARTEDTLYRALLPMLSTSAGRLVAMSTPNGDIGWWAGAWRSDEAWQRSEVPATSCLRISPEFLADAKRSMGEWWYRQEFCCEFMDAEGSVFRSDDIRAALSAEVQPLLAEEVA